jgi:hypothetical protein
MSCFFIVPSRELKYSATLSESQMKKLIIQIITKYLILAKKWHVFCIYNYDIILEVRLSQEGRK